MISAATCRTKDTPAHFSRLSTANSSHSPTRKPLPRQPFHRIRVQHRVGSTEHGSYIDEPLALITGSGATAKTYFYHANSLFSVAALTDSAGAVAERYRYDAYGKRTALAADGTTVRATSTAANQIGFTGQYLDKETGLYYFNARMHSPALGRLVSRDPAEYVDGASLYSGYFVPNGLDPSGETNISVAFKAFIPGSLGRKFKGAPGTWGKAPGQDPRGRSMWSYWFATDDRDFGQDGTSRVSSWGNVDSMELGIVNVFSLGGSVGESGQLTHNKLTGNNSVERKTAPKKGNESGANTRPCESTFTFVGEASYPFSIFAPEIDYTVKFKVTVVAAKMVRVCVSGSHDGFPAYEALVNNSVIYKHMPADKGPGLGNLNSSITLPETCVTIVADTRDCCH